ncbi:SH3 domain-containing protein [Streptomyces roseoverticillatus]|uniref:SH3 domain-containing protein n=1 Tax=Streptomyces roseoverticillatus TaxID=66429 RepID=A0ABV3J352_9ACTN
MATSEINKNADENTADKNGNVGENESPTLSARSAAATVYYPVAPGQQVNVRRGPNTGSQIVRVLPEDSRVAIRCQTRGETVTGPYGTTDIWDSIAPGQYVSDAYVKTGSDGFVTIRCS